MVVHSSIILFTIIMITVPLAAQTSGVTLTGTVYISKCPPDNRMGMPCVLEPVPACTVLITGYTSGGTIEPLPAPLPKDSAIILKKIAVFEKITTTDQNGVYKLPLDPSFTSGGTIILSAYTQSLQGQAKTILSGAAVEKLDIYLQATITPPQPEPYGYATVTGIVYSSDKKPVSGASVVVYPISEPVTIDPVITSAGFSGTGATPGSEDQAPTPVYYDTVITIDPKTNDTVYSTDTLSIEPANPGYPFEKYAAVTDLSGRYTIKGIAVWSNPLSVSSVAGTNYTVFASKDGQSAEQQVLLTQNALDTVDLILSVSTVPPPVSGTSGIKGIVYKQDKTTSGLILTPVPGCTVVVASAYTPLAVSKDVAVPPSMELYYTAVTDDKGYYAIPLIKVWSNQYAVVVMAQKNGLFGISKALLEIGKTAVADVILDQAPFVYIDPSQPGAMDTGNVMIPEAQFYKDALSAYLPVKQPVESGKSRLTVPVAVRGSVLSITVPVSQKITVTALSLNGQVITVLCNNRWFGTGTGIINLGAAALSKGKMILKIQGEHFSIAVALNNSAR